MGLPVSLCHALRESVNFECLAMLAEHRINRAKDLLADPRKNEVQTALLRGEIVGYKHLLGLKDIVEKTLDGIKKEVDEIK